MAGVASSTMPAGSASAATVCRQSAPIHKGRRCAALDELRLSAAQVQVQCIERGIHILFPFEQQPVDALKRHIARKAAVIQVKQQPDGRLTLAAGRFPPLPCVADGIEHAPHRQAALARAVPAHAAAANGRTGRAHYGAQGLRLLQHQQSPAAPSLRADSTETGRRIAARTASQTGNG